jgi:hypothetical protein
MTSSNVEQAVERVGSAILLGMSVVTAVAVLIVGG